MPFASRIEWKLEFSYAMKRSQSVVVVGTRVLFQAPGVLASM